MWDTHNSRKPLLSFRLFGLFLLRDAHRAQACPTGSRRHRSVWYTVGVFTSLA